MAEGLKARRGFYVASRASLPERGQMWRDFRAAGVPINATWIDEDGPKASRDLSGLWVRIVAEVCRSERLVLYVEPDDFPLKGALIEIGAALAAGVPVVIVAAGVVLEERNCRPLGSWIKHPLVSFADSVEKALTRPEPSRQEREKASDLIERATEAMVGLNPLTGFGEDAVWRPANRAWKALYDIRAFLSAFTHPQPSPVWRPDREAVARLVEGVFRFGYEERASLYNEDGQQTFTAEDLERERAKTVAEFTAAILALQPPTEDRGDAKDFSSVACSAEPSLASPSIDAGSATPSGGK